MRALIQRVLRATVTVHPGGNTPLTGIEKGLLILAGFDDQDEPRIIESMVRKIAALRIFLTAKAK